MAAASFRCATRGPGIAPEHIPRLTERFYRVDRSRSRETGGTGLGLAIVKHVVQRHGAELADRQHARPGLDLRDPVSGEPAARRAQLAGRYDRTARHRITGRMTLSRASATVAAAQNAAGLCRGVQAPPWW